MKDLTNNAYSTLLGALTSAGTSFLVQSGHGNLRFASKNIDILIYPATYRNSISAFIAGKLEILLAETRSSDTFSGLLRAQQGTTALDFTDPDETYVVESGATAETFTSLPMKSPVRAATTAPVTLSGAQTIDAVVLVAGDRVLVKDQATHSENGIYDIASGAWTRSVDFDNSQKLYGGCTIAVLSGTVNGGSLWEVTTTGSISPGTDAIDFAKIGAKVALAYGIASLDSTGKVPSAQLPEAIAENPSTRYLMEEDFDGGLPSTSELGRQQWGVSGINGNDGYVLSSTTGARGEVAIKTGTGANAKAYIFSPVGTNSSTFGIFKGDEPFTLLMRVALINVGAPETGTKKFFWGLTEDYATPTKGIYFSAIDAATIQAICHDGSAATIDTLVAQSDSYATFKIISTGTSITFYINNNLVATITTHIPTTWMKFFFHSQCGTDGVAKAQHVDYCYCKAASQR